MQLTELQIQCQKLGADKVMSFGCMLERYDYVYKKDKIVIYKRERDSGSIAILEIEGKNERHISTGQPYTIIGHPITYSRLCYLRSRKFLSYEQEKLWLQIEYCFIDDICLYNQSILEWNEQIQLLFRDFLLSIQ